MSKSLGNAIALGDDADTVASRIKRARTDAERHITYDPVNRAGIAVLIDLAALCSGRCAEDIAAEVGSAGAAALKNLTIDAVDAFLAPLRERRARFDASDAHRLLGRGIETANDIADATLAEVRDAMGMTYGRHRTRRASDCVTVDG